MTLSQPQINNWKALIPTFAVAPRLTIFTPLQFPLNEKIIFIDKISNYLTNRIIRKYIESPYVLILNDPRPPTMKIAENLISYAALSIFDWSDDFAEFSSDEEGRRTCSSICEYFCRNVDVVITVNDMLRMRASIYNKNSFTVKNATNYFNVNNIIYNTNKQNPFDVIKRPRVAYIGWLNSLRLDHDIIYHAVRERPDISFIFMGPKVTQTLLGDTIPSMPNVHILPSVPYSEYVKCLSSTDVCILPNKINNHTMGNDPIKIYDYMASGCPVVATKHLGLKRLQIMSYWPKAGISSWTV